MKISILLNNNSCVQVDQLDNSGNYWNYRRNKNTENKTINGCSARILNVRGGSPASDERPGNPIDCTSTFEEPAGVGAGASLFN